MSFEDELRDSLHSAGDMVDVRDPGAAAVEKRAGRRASRNRAMAGLGAFALFAGVLGGTYAVTRDSSDRVDTFAETGDDITRTAPESSDQAATSELAVGAAARPPENSEPIEYGVLPLAWEVLDNAETPRIFDLKVDGDRVYGQGDDGWIWVSEDFVTWAPLPIPDSIAPTNPETDRPIKGWVNDFDVVGDVIAITVESSDGEFLDGPQPAFAGTAAASASSDVGESDPCVSSFGRGATSTVLRSADAGATWTSVEMPDLALPAGRFVGDSTTTSIATDGSSVIVGTEQYLNLNIECILAESGVDLSVIESGGGFGWDDTGVQIYSVVAGPGPVPVDAVEEDFGEDFVEEFGEEERMVATYTWAELGLSDAELAAVTDMDHEREGTLTRMSANGSMSVLDAIEGQVFDLIGIDGEYLAIVFERSGQKLLRSSDAGATWVESESTGSELTGLVRYGSGVLIRHNGFTNDVEVSHDAGRTWVNLGSPRGPRVENLGVIGATALASGFAGYDVYITEGDDVIIDDSFESTASLDGYSITVSTGFSDLPDPENPESPAMSMTLVDDSTGEVLLNRSVPIDEMPEGDGDDIDVGWMVIKDGVVTFFGDDGEELAQFLDADIEAAFEASSDFGEDSVSRGRGSSSSDQIAVPPPISVPGPPDFPQDGIVLSYRSQDGTWVSQRLSDFVPDAGWIRSITAFRDAFYVIIEPNYEGSFEEGFDPTFDDESFEPAIPPEFDLPVSVLVLRP